MRRDELALTITIPPDKEQDMYREGGFP